MAKSDTGKPKKEIVKRAPRTPKEKKFVKAYLANGGNKSQAVFASYDVKPGDYNTATRIGHELTQKLTLVELFDEIEGLRPQDRLYKLVEGLNATKSISGIGDAGSRSVEFVEVPDMPTRYKYLELTFKLDGSLKAAEITNNTQNNITVSPILSGLSNALPGHDGDQEAAQS